MLISYLCYSLLLLGENQSSSGFLNFKLLLLLFLVIKKKILFMQTCSACLLFHWGGGRFVGFLKNECIYNGTKKI